MNFSFVRLLLFALGSLAVLGLVAVYDVQVEDMVDPLTGVSLGEDLTQEAIPLFPTPEDVYRLARNRGNARAALFLMQGLQPRMSEPEVIEEMLADLRDEVLTAVEVSHRLERKGVTTPDLDLRREALLWLAKPVGEHTDLAETLMRLEDLEMDRRVAGSIEAFFFRAVREDGAEETWAQAIAGGVAPDRAAAAAMVLVGGHADRVPAERCLELADAFAANNRPRAALRWLIRAFCADPTSSESVFALSQFYLDRGRQREALVVVSAAVRAGADGLEIQQRRRDLASWTSETEEEALALEATLRFEERADTRERLIALYDFLGRIEDAIPHIVTLARQTGTAEALGDAAAVALSAGKTDLALTLLDEASKLADDPRPWRDRILEILMLDLRTEEALTELRALAGRYPEMGYRDRLEDLLSLTGKDEELAERLLVRVREGPDPAREEEAIHLLTVLGRTDAVREVLTLQFGRITEPGLFFRKLRVFTILGLPGLAEKVMAIANSAEMTAESAVIGLYALQDLGQNPGYLDAALVIANRFPDLPESIEFFQSIASGQAEGEAGEITDEERLRQLLEEAKRPDLTLEDRERIAELLFQSDRMDVALTLFESVLAEKPDDRMMLLRIGQIRAWGNDPYGALAFFERCFELYGPGDGELPFLLGESYYSMERDGEGREQFEIALPLLRSEGELTPVRESMVAKILARFGRGEEARAIYERLLATCGESAALLLDYADTLIVLEDLAAARIVADRARALDPDDSRVLRLSGMLHFAAGDLEAALADYERGRSLYGPDAGFSAGAAEALSGLGRLHQAFVAYDEAVSLQPDNLNFGWSRRRLLDLVASPVIEFEARTLTAGSDRVRETSAEGSLLLDEDETRLSAVLTLGSYEGAGTGEDGLTRTFSADLGTLGFGLARRFGAEITAAGGLDLYPTRSGIHALGLWAEARRATRIPYSSAEARIFAGEPLREPAAVVAMDGARHGLDLSGYYQPEDAGYWVSGSLGFQVVTLDPPGRSTRSQSRVRAELALGAWIVNAGPEIQERLTPRESLVAREGSTVAGEPPNGRGPRLGAWLGWSGMRTLGGDDLTRFVPIADGYDYVTATVRGVESLGAGILLEGEAYAGTEFGRTGIIGGATLGLAWRPNEDVELRLNGSRGFAKGRSDGGQGATSLRLALTVNF